MSPMLEFLSMPGNYFANLQSSYASSSGSNAGDSNNILGGVTGLLTNNPLTTGLTGLIGDGSLSRKVTRTLYTYNDKTVTIYPWQDFIIELTTWFRRAIWFLGFTAAFTASAPLFVLTAVLAAVFELLYNVTNARAYWDSVSEYDFLSEHSDDIGNIDYINRLDLTAPSYPYQYYRTVTIPQLTYKYSPDITGRRLNTEGLELKPSSVKNSGDYRDSINYLLGLPPSSLLFKKSQV